MSHEQELEERFDALYKAHKPMVLQLCLGYAKGDVELASDLCQEVLINTWNALPGFRAEASVKTWIYRITVNTCLLYLRKESKSPIAPINMGTMEREVPIPEGESNASKALYKAIGELPPLDRFIIMLVLEELEYEEIERIVGISAVNLRVRIHRIRRKMKKSINQTNQNG